MIGLYSFVCWLSLFFWIVTITKEETLIIKNSSVGMESARTYTSVSKEATHVKIHTTPTFLTSLNNNYSGKGLDQDIKSEDKNSNSVPDKVTESYDNIFEKLRARTSSDFSYRNEVAEFRNRLIAQCVQYLINLLLGIKSDSSSMEQSAPSADNALTSVESGEFQVGITTVEANHFSFQSETEETTFSTTGTVVTGDGREISFNLDLSLSRSFTSYYEDSIKSVSGFVDPLVINLDAPSAEVSDVKISFDIDGDGTEDSISTLSSSSGYLSLDLNGDGIINDGTELFGTKSGDGFSDLAAYDSDNNGWIDEQDEIFDKLKICVMKEDGSQELYKLSDKGVGAICLQRANTEFSLNSLTTNNANARIRQTGIFLYENGNVGTVQHLDLAQ